MRRLALVLALALGCGSTPEPGESDFSLVEGSLVAVEKVDLARVHRAAVAVMTRMGLRPHERERDAMSTLIVGEVMVGVIPQSREIRVRLERLGGDRTRIAMRILFTRDREKLELILFEIKKELDTEAEKENAPAPAPPEKESEAGADPKS